MKNQVDSKYEPAKNSSPLGFLHIIRTSWDLNCDISPHACLLSRRPTEPSVVKVEHVFLKNSSLKRRVRLFFPAKNFLRKSL